MTTPDPEYVYELTVPHVMRERLEPHGHRAWSGLGAAISILHGRAPEAPHRLEVRFGVTFDVRIRGPRTPLRPGRQVVTAALLGAWAASYVLLSEDVQVLDVTRPRVPHA